jgi:alpha-L-fucosidase 2
MKVLTAIGLLGFSAASLLAASPLTLWYRQPARIWVEALPVGNGKLGAMIFGGMESERIQFNEQTVWTGAPHDYAHKGAYQSLDKLRALLWAGKQKEAEDLAMKEFMSEPLRQKAYQAFGDLLLDFPGIDESAVSDYRRSLDLNTAIATVEFQAKGVTYRREIFASYPAKAIVIRLTASRLGCVSFSAGFKSAHQGSTINVLGDGDLVMDGQVEDGAIRFEARLNVAAQGGQRETRDGRAVVEGADSATLVLTGATNFVNYTDVSGDPKARNASYMVGAHIRSYDRLRAEHIADYQNLFGRVALDLGTSPAAANPTDARIRDFAGGHDPQLVALMFQYGRYLLISSSRLGGQPANLQGLWNQSNTPPWDSKYTTNINTEMNYWPAEETNLAECQAPLFAAMKDLQASGAITAKEEYNARGWVLHHNFDLWRGTAPINAPHDGLWQPGAAWLATGLWEHYLFSGDRQFLRDTAYPLMKGAALFFTDTLVKDPKSGYLVTGPSNSPEQGGLVMGPTMDREIVRTLFGEVIAASRILNVDSDLLGQLTEMRGRIAPHRIGQYKQLQEWMEDVDDPKNQHRHVSHLWAVYPGSEITPYGTPDLFAAARQSLIYRGDEATGWSLAWKLNLWARFLDGEHAYRILRNLVTPASDKGPGTPSHAGLYANLFDAHPPFQIDGNFGATAGITEMLLQSDDPHGTPTSLTPAETGDAAFLTLLPALPSAFPSGSVSGLRARGGVGVALEWRDGKLAKATLRPSASQPVTLRYDGREVTFDAQAGKTYEAGPDLKVRP